MGVYKRMASFGVTQNQVVMAENRKKKEGILNNENILLKTKLRTKSQVLLEPCKLESCQYPASVQYHVNVYKIFTGFSERGF